MYELIGFLQWLLTICIWILIIQIVMSWLIAFQVLNMHQPLVAQIYHGLNRLLAPIYEPVRRRMPNTGGLDLSPLVIFIGIIFLRDVVLENLSQVL